MFYIRLTTCLTTFFITRMYLDQLYFPIYLFNRYDDRIVGSFSTIKKLVKAVQLNNKYNFESVFYPEKERDLFAVALTHFPYIFFLTEKLNISTLPRLMNNNPRILDPNRFLNLYNKRINVKSIWENCDKIQQMQDCSVNAKGFINHLFNLLYKYAFVEVASSLKLNERNYQLKDYLDDYKKYKKDSFIMGGQILEYSIQAEPDIVKKSIDEMSFLSRSHNASKLFYFGIDNNITLPDTLSSTAKNKLLRPLFYEIICNICYPRFHNDYQLDSPELVEKFRLFLREYNKLK